MCLDLGSTRSGLNKNVDLQIRDNHAAGFHYLGHVMFGLWQHYGKRQLLESFQFINYNIHLHSSLQLVAAYE